METSFKTIKPVKVRNSFTPLCYMPDGRLVCYQYGNLFVMKDEIVSAKYRLSDSYRERFLGRIGVVYRSMRLGVRAAVAIDNDIVLLSVGNTIVEFDTHTGELSKGYYCGKGIRPLIITTVKGIKGFDDGVYFGGYLGNSKKRPVSIYKRSGTDKWEVVYTFPEGAINHVHNVVADPYRQKLWIFTGDFDEAAAIWSVTDGFKNVERVACNDQKYRGCVVYALPEGLLYASDAPFADDFIYLMNTETYEVKELFPIHGSCIYGCKWKDQYVFSSTIEGDGRDTSRWEFYFGRKRGAGIKDNYVHLYYGDLKNGFKEIYKEKKDCLPYYSFQFGVFRFPYGENNSNALYFQPVATKKNDLHLLKIVDQNEL